MSKQIAGATVDLGDDGYLTELSQWTKDIALELAKEEGIELSDVHWTVIEYLQNSYRNSQPLSIRSLGKHGPVSIKEFYELFPDGPLKKASRIAGIPKPASCV
jgi:TusE/DsrC/DsvC family sulfur relay protein